MAFSSTSVFTKVARLKAEAVLLNPKLVSTTADTAKPFADFKVLTRPGLILRPDMIKVADRILLPTREGVPRDQVQAPIAPAEGVSDTALYEDPANPDRHYYLPRYRVARTGDRVRIALRKADDGWRLEVDLEKFLPPELAESGREAAELPHTITAQLSYELPVASSASGAAIVVDATISTTDDGLTRASFSATQPDELVLALSDVDRLTKLVVRRSFRAAVQSGPASETSDPVVRDHRAPDPVVRDHRVPDPVVRDHRTPDPVVRDHRTLVGGYVPDRGRWMQQGARLNSGPDPSSWGAGRLDVFGQGPDAAIWHKWYENGWSDWESLGGGLTSDATAVSWGPGRIDMFARGQDNALWHKWYENAWSDWESLGGGLSSGPDACSAGPGHLDVFVRGLDDALWHRWYSGGWSEWESLGGGLTSDPGAVSWGPGRVDVFVRGTDNALWHRGWEGAWAEWESLGGGLSSGPDVGSMGAGHLDVFARGLDNALWHRWFQGGWSEWESLGGALNSDPGVVCWGAGRVDVFARSNTDTLSHIWYEGAWSAWEDLGAPGGVEAAAGPLYLEGDHLLEDVAEPERFYFSKDLHGYIYGGVTGGSAEELTLKRHTIPWGDENYLYLQRASEPHVFFYLPDGFKLARDPDPPHKPTLVVRISPGALDEVQVDLEYLSFASVDPERLAGTADQLRERVDSELPEGVSAPVYQPLPVSQENVTFRLTLPRAENGSSKTEEQTDALIDVSSAISGSISRSLSGFQSIFDALLSSSGSASVFVGTIEVAGLGGETPEVIPFTARLDDLATPPLDVVHRDTGHTWEVTLTNAIESPVHVRELAAAVEYGDGSLTGEAEIVEVSETLPVDLDPGATLELAVRPTPHAAGRITGVQIDQSEVDVRPDKEKIWEAILDTSVEPAYERSITVVATYVFQAEGESTEIQEVLVDFERGGTVVLTPAALEAEAKVQVPIADLILRREQESSYRYRLQVVRRGRVARDRPGDWREDDIDRLLLSVDELPRSAAAGSDEEEPVGDDEPA